jgi:translation initiation factor IF-3
VFLIGPDGTTYGETGREQALWFALDQELDLVEVGPGATPPVVRVMDYHKYLYDKEKQARKQAKKQRGAGEVKEVKLGYKTDEHDVATKARRATEFLERGNRVKVTMILRGREQAFGPQALDRIDHFRQQVDAVYDQSATRQGNRITSILKRNA